MLKRLILPSVLFNKFGFYKAITLKQICHFCYVALPVRSLSKVPVKKLNSISFYSTSSNNGDNSEGVMPNLVGGSVIKNKYEPFIDKNAPIILDVIEERQRIHDIEDDNPQVDEFAGLNLERGKTGVFDVEDLVDVLQNEKAKNIFVVKIPPHLQYVDYIIVVTGRSLKHMLGLAEYIRKVYKIKRHKTDRIPRIEGESSKDWLALDLGNIALHIMSPTARTEYDIDTLWAVGKEYDEKFNEDTDPLEKILQKHSINLDDFLPADKNR